MFIDCLCCINQKITAKYRQQAWPKLVGITATNDSGCTSYNDYTAPQLAQTTSSDEQKQQPPEGKENINHNNTNNNIEEKKGNDIDVSLDMIRRDVGRSVIFKYNKNSGRRDNEETVSLGTNSHSFNNGIIATTSTSEKLTRILNDTIRQSTTQSPSTSTLFYYQGLHDIAGVILHNMDYEEDLAKEIMKRICHSHLRDAMRENFSNITWLLSVLLPPLLEKIDPNVHYVMQVSQVDLATICLPWIITWFTHDIHDPITAGRLVDAFLAGHPLMAMYFSVALITNPIWKQTLLEVDCDDPASVFVLFKKMPLSLVVKNLSDENSKNDNNNNNNNNDRQTVPIQEILDDSISIM